MTAEIFYWIIGASLVSLIGVGIKAHGILLENRRLCRKLIKMHEDPDKYGFGTEGTNKLLAESWSAMTECIANLTRVTKGLMHYVRWLTEHPGEPAPPPTDDSDL